MPRSLITIDDLSNDEIMMIFDLADEFLVNDSWRVSGRRDLANDYILSTLFYEPSTRTRFSFESAMLRLGGHILSSTDPKTTSSAKGESLADTIRVVQNYADIIALRHPYEGAARLAAEFSDVPVINAGDGSHEHPTQTLCDLYTLRREKKGFKDLNVLLCGDLKNGRTVHSLVYALARFGANIYVRSAPGFGLPDHVSDRLEKKYGFRPQEGPLKDVDAVYRAPDEQQTLFTLDIQMSRNGDSVKKPRSSHIDVCYVTRLQLERLDEAHAAQYPTVDKKFLKRKEYEHSSVLHPLPRVDELGYDMDHDPRGVYFKQASYGVPIRMALLTALLQLRFCFTADPKWQPYDYEIYTQGRGVRCPVPQCITNHEAEKRHLRSKFWIVEHEPITLRCTYCEHEIKPRVVGHLTSKTFSNISERKMFSQNTTVFFMDERAARTAGFHTPRKPAKRNQVA